MIWSKLSGAEELRCKYPPSYATELLYPGGYGVHNGADGGRDWSGSADALSKAEVEINKDINRTFSDAEIRECLAAVGLDRNMALQWFGPKLKRLLLAYARHDAAIGYCQSLNYLGGLLVIVIDAEEDCFLSLIHI